MFHEQKKCNLDVYFVNLISYLLIQSLYLTKRERKKSSLKFILARKYRLKEKKSGFAGFPKFCFVK